MVATACSLTYCATRVPFPMLAALPDIMGQSRSQCGAPTIISPWGSIPLSWKPWKRRCTMSGRDRSEEHTSELQSLMRISYAVFCLKKKHTYLTHPHPPFRSTAHYSHILILSFIVTHSYHTANYKYPIF